MTLLDLKKGSRSAFIITCAAGLEAQASAEICRLLPDAEVSGLFLKGNLLLLSILEEGDVIARIAHADTCYLGRITPVQTRVDIGVDREEAVAAIAEAVIDIGRLNKGKIFAVRCRRRGRHRFSSREIEKQVALALEARTGAQGEYLSPVDWAVVIEIFQDRAFIGINPPERLIHKPILSARKYPPGERPLNRAQQKIREALEAFAIHISPRHRVLDIGAAPGGWTAHLASLAKEVYGVDPAELAPAAKNLQNVVHLRVRADVLAERKDLREAFDLITNDMNIEAAESARLMVKLAPLLKSRGRAIMTVKYMTPRRREQEKEAFAILSSAYEDIQIKRLPHNRRETTAAMKKGTRTYFLSPLLAEGREQC